MDFCTQIQSDLVTLTLDLLTLTVCHILSFIHTTNMQILSILSVPEL